MPRAARSRASWAPMPLDAPVTMPAVSRKSRSPAIGLARRAARDRRSAGPAAGHDAQHLTDEARHESRAEELRIVEGETALVLGETRLGEAPQRHLADRLGHLHGEVVARVVAAKLERRADAPERLQRDAETTPHEEAGLAVERELQAPVRHPVDEEQDVARLLLHHAVEALDQGPREDAGIRGEPEEAEGEERVEALPVPHAQEAPLGIAGPLARTVGACDLVVREHALKQRCMAALLVALHRDGFAQHGIALGVRHCL